MPTPIAPLSEKLPSAARERAVEVLTRHFAPQAKAGGTGDPGSIVRITGRAAFGFAEANIES